MSDLFFYKLSNIPFLLIFGLKGKVYLQEFFKSSGENGIILDVKLYKTPKGFTSKTPSSKAHNLDTLKEITQFSIPKTIGAKIASNYAWQNNKKKTFV